MKLDIVIGACYENVRNKDRVAVKSVNGSEVMLMHLDSSNLDCAPCSVKGFLGHYERSTFTNTERVRLHRYKNSQKDIVRLERSVPKFLVDELNRLIDKELEEWA